MHQDVSGKILPVGQNQCPMRKNFKFPAERDEIHPGSLGKATRIHLSLSSVRNMP